MYLLGKHSDDVQEWVLPSNWNWSSPCKIGCTKICAKKYFPAIVQRSWNLIAHEVRQRHLIFKVKKVLSDDYRPHPSRILVSKDLDGQEKDQIL